MARRAEPTKETDDASPKPKPKPLPEDDELSERSKKLRRPADARDDRKPERQESGDAAD